MATRAKQNGIGSNSVHLLVALVPAALAAPAGAQLQEALTAQAQVDRDAAQSQEQLNDIRERTQDAAGRYAQAMADADSLERFNAQLQEQVDAQEAEIMSIQTQLLDIETTNREVQPLMQQMVDTLARFVELDVPNPKLQLAPGMFADVRWPISRAQASLFVPATAVVRMSERQFVIRVSNGLAEWVDVRRGETSDDQIEVFGDLRAGDVVVRRGNDELRPGSRIR